MKTLKVKKPNVNIAMHLEMMQQKQKLGKLESWEFAQMMELKYWVEQGKTWLHGNSGEFVSYEELKELEDN